MSEPVFLTPTMYHPELTSRHSSDSVSLKDPALPSDTAGDIDNAITTASGPLIDNSNSILADNQSESESFSMLSPPLSPYPLSFAQPLEPLGFSRTNSDPLYSQIDNANYITTKVSGVKRSLSTGSTNPVKAPSAKRQALQVTNRPKIVREPSLVDSSLKIVKHVDNDAKDPAIDPPDENVSNLSSPNVIDTNIANTVPRYTPNTPLVNCAWANLRHNPSAYLKRERALLSLYARHKATSPNYVVTAASTVSNRIRRRVAGANYNSSGSRRTNYSSESDAVITRAKSKRPNGSVTPRPQDSTKNASLPLAFFHKTSGITAESNYNTDRSRVGTPGASVGSSITPKPSRSSTPKPPRPIRPRTTVNSPDDVNSSNVHDVPYEMLPNFEPSTDLLPAGKSLRADWKGQPRDMSQDPELSQLHPAEVYLASILRLKADGYLDAKRRMFAEKVFRLRDGMLFRRTDAQKACRIDVNKASRLFNAYEKVGWLNDALFQKYL